MFRDGGGSLGLEMAAAVWRRQVFRDGGGSLCLEMAAAVCV